MRLRPKVRITSKVSYDVLSSTCIEPDLGRCDPNTRQIIINPNQSDKEAELTFLHEIIHAVSFEYEIELTESQVVLLEKGLSKLFKLNKNLQF